MISSSLITLSIVDDLPAIRQAMQILIDSVSNYACISSHATGEEALQAIPALHPDIVLMDIGLPGMSGIDCIRQLKPLCPKTQFMICTVYDSDDAVLHAITAGAGGYILKSYDNHDIIKAIEELHNGGSPMNSDIARKLVNHFQRAAAPGQHEILLTIKEKEIMTQLAKGLTYKQAADIVCISEKTIKKHIYNIYEKLQVNSRTAAINKYYGQR